MTVDSGARARAAFFEGLHRRGEPFDYSRRAVEILRHRYVCEAVRRLNPHPRKLLDVGCSMGQLTVQLAGVASALVAVDLSRTAIGKARDRLRGTGAQARFVLASVTALPFHDGSFDVVVLSDGLHSWQIPREERQLALAEAHQVLEPSGHALLTEYLQPRVFPQFVAQVRSSPLEVVWIEYLYDRLWYQIESWFKAVRRWTWVERLFASVSFARFLCTVGRFFGGRGSRHIAVAARKAP